MYKLYNYFKIVIFYLEVGMLIKKFAILVFSMLCLNTFLFGSTKTDAKDHLIETNSTIEESISKEGEIDTFKFILKYKSKVELFTSGITDTYGILLDKDKNEIIDDDDNGEYTNFKISKTLDAGIYYIKVQGYTQWDTGDYKLHYIVNELPKDKQGSTIEEAYQFSLNSSIDALINESGDIDVFSLDIDRDGKLTFYTKGETDTYCYLLNSDGNVINEDDDNGEITNCKIETTVSKGRYYIKIRGYSKWDIGRYTVYNSYITFEKEDDYPNNFEDAYKIELNSTKDINGTINYQNDEDFFYFTLKEPKIVKLCAQASNIDIKIYNSEYQEIDKNTTMIHDGIKDPTDLSYCDGKNKDSITILNQVLASGTYYINTTSYKEQMYKLFIKKSPIIYIGDNIENAKDIDKNKIYSAAIESFDDIDIFKITLSDRKLLKISSSKNQKFTLLDSNGNEISTYDDLFNSTNQVFLIKKLYPGTYYVKFKSMNYLYEYSLTYITINVGRSH